MLICDKGSLVIHTETLSNYSCLTVRYLNVLPGAPLCSTVRLFMLPFLRKEEPALSILDCLCHVSYLIHLLFTIYMERLGLLRIIVNVFFIYTISQKYLLMF